MAAFKQFNSQDIIVSPLELNKSFSFSGSAALTASNVGIDRFLGNNTNELTTSGYISSEYRSSIYHSIKQLYYTNYLSGSEGQTSNVATASFNNDGTITGQVYSPLFNNFEQTDLNPEKYFPTGSYSTIVYNPAAFGAGTYGGSQYGLSNLNPQIAVMSIPKNLYGDYIQPNSLRITTDSGSYKDDGEGRIVRYKNSTEVFVGNIIYQHGIIVLTGGDRRTALGEGGTFGDSEYGSGLYNGRTFGNNDIENFYTGSSIKVDFSSSFQIFETQYKCTIGESEYNFTLNPSIISSSREGSIYDWATGSFFDPYVTTVGMYDEQENLLAVGKLAKPLPTSRTTDTTILINLDRQ